MTTHAETPGGSVDLVARAAALRPLLEQHADETDRLRRLADANVAALKERVAARVQ